MPLTFYHGTSTGSGLEAGDRLDPRHSEHETCVWGTASLAYASYWASSRDAIYNEGEVVFVIDLDADAKTMTSSADLSEASNVIAQAVAGGYDAVIFENGEDGAPMIAVLNGYSARAKAQ